MINPYEAYAKDVAIANIEWTNTNTPRERLFPPKLRQIKFTSEPIIILILIMTWNFTEPMKKESFLLI